MSEYRSPSTGALPHRAGWARPRPRPVCLRRAPITPAAAPTAGEPAPARCPARGRRKPATGTVSFAHWRAEDKAVFDTLIATFTKANPGAKVTQDISPSNDYQSTALQKIKGGTSATPSPRSAERSSSTWSRPACIPGLGTQPFVDNYYAKLVKAGQDPAGPSWACPTSWCSTCRIYNEDAFEQAGVNGCPKDWDGFLALCENLKGAGVPIAWPGGEPATPGS